MGGKKEEYLALAKKYLAEGEVFLAKGDLTQASEKLWGSVAETIKAVAEVRGWEHSRHRDLAEVVERLLRETGDFELVELYGVAERLHANFYENFIDPMAAGAYAERIRRLKAKLEKLLSNSFFTGSQLNPNSSTKWPEVRSTNLFI